MGLKDRLKSDLTEAIRSSDKVVSGTIRMVLTAITNEEVSGKEARVLSDDEIITVLSREGKKRREAADEFAKAGRPERAADEKAEGEVIAKYLPAQLSEEEVKNLIAAAIASTGAAGPADMGKVMGAIKPQIAGKADGSIVSSLVKATLAGGK
ncbi:MAG: GatB/YqeY domain-containing protein [Candidatus Planktophila sp.]|mgnify:FL=1